jgi:hypothetical protein
LVCWSYALAVSEASKRRPIEGCIPIKYMPYSLAMRFLFAIFA